MLRRALLVVAMLAFAPAAWAADAAESLVLGYSADGRYFAFEQFGIQDGSGSAFSDIFIIDLQANSWVEGTPIRRGGNGDEETKLVTVRKESAAAAAPLLARLAITVPATILAGNPATQVAADRTRVTFDRWYQSMGGSGPITGDYVPDQRYELRVTTRPVDPQPADCTYADDAVQLLSLTLTTLKTGHERLVYKDETLPKSRDCPQSYDIDKLVTPADYDTAGRPVAIVGVYSRGFEGYDRRYIAIPILIE